GHGASAAGAPPATPPPQLPGHPIGRPRPGVAGEDVLRPFDQVVLAMLALARMSFSSRPLLLLSDGRPAGNATVVTEPAPCAIMCPMLTIYIDADACPVKDEVYRVARRYAMSVKVVANAPLRVPADARIELVVRPGFGSADDWIAEQAGPGDIVITSDIPLAARCLAREARVLGPKGVPFTESDIGSALALRDLLAGLRPGGGGPPPPA